MKKSKIKKGDILTKSKKTVFSKKYAAKVKDILLATIIKEIR